MPRKQRFAKARNEITPNQIEQLITGHDFFGGGFTDEKEMKQAWIDNREKVLQKAAEYHSQFGDGLLCPVYAELRFDQGLSHHTALEYLRRTRSNATEKTNRQRSNLKRFPAFLPFR